MGTRFVDKPDNHAKLESYELGRRYDVRVESVAEDGTGRAASRYPGAYRTIRLVGKDIAPGKKYPARLLNYGDGFVNMEVVKPVSAAEPVPETSGKTLDAIVGNPKGELTKSEMLCLALDLTKITLRNNCFSVYFAADYSADSIDSTEVIDCVGLSLLLLSKHPGHIAMFVKTTLESYGLVQDERFDSKDGRVALFYFDIAREQPERFPDFIDMIAERYLSEPSINGLRPRHYYDNPKQRQDLETALDKLSSQIFTKQ